MPIPAGVGRVTITCIRCENLSVHISCALSVSLCRVLNRCHFVFFVYVLFVKLLNSYWCERPTVL